MLATYNYPILDIFWSIFMLFGFLLLLFLVAWCLWDSFRRHDHGGLAKAAWVVVLIFVPIIGILAYIITKPGPGSGRMRASY